MADQVTASLVQVLGRYLVFLRRTLVIKGTTTDRRFGGLGKGRRPSKGRAITKCAKSPRLRPL